jgi:hypothetical protein
MHSWPILYNMMKAWQTNNTPNKFLIIKPTRCTNFSNLFLKWNSCFRQFLCPSSGVFHCTPSNGICHTSLLTYATAVCTVKNSWWWAEELSKTCRVSFQEYIWEISASSWSYYKKFITMHGHMNVKLNINVCKNALQNFQTIPTSHAAWPNYCHRQKCRIPYY